MIYVFKRHISPNAAKHPHKTYPHTTASKHNYMAKHIHTVHRAEAEKLLSRSRKFADAAEFHFMRGDYDLSVFNIEQALQLFLKAMLLKNGVDFPKTHSVGKLFIILGECLGKEQQFTEFSEKHALEFASLEDAYISSRYFPREFTRKEAESLGTFFSEVKKFVQQHTGEGGA